MKSLLLLTLLFLQTPSRSTEKQAQSTDILISWSYPTLEVVDVPREYNGTLKVNSRKPIPARVTVSQASMSREGLITLEGQVTYAKACTMRFRFRLNGLGNPVILNTQPGSQWTETLERCPLKTVAPSFGAAPTTYASSLELIDTKRQDISALGAFSMVWTTSDGLSRDLKLKGEPSAYLRVYRQK